MWIVLKFVKDLKGCALKLTEVLLNAQAFMNYCSLLVVQQNKNNNPMQNKIYSNGIKSNIETYSDVINYKNMG